MSCSAIDVNQTKIESHVEKRRNYEESLGGNYINTAGPMPRAWGL
jgi:hypothetical protein